jgi:low affinity Fe/Cu permease
VILTHRLQNKDSRAIQQKLNELKASTEGASNRLVDVEDISEEELEVLKKHYRKLARLFEQEKNIKESHSIEEAEKRHKKTYHNEKQN